MIQMNQIEMRRAFKSKPFAVALLIGMCISMGQLIMEVLPKSQDILAGYNGSSLSYIYSVYNSWMGMSNSVFMYLFKLILPILAAMPFAVSYYLDVKRGYIRQLLIRADRKEYLIPKMRAVFLSGGVVVTIPLVINLFVTYMMLPSLAPVPNGLFALAPGSVGGSLYYSYPYLYVFCCLILYFIYGGVYALLAMVGAFIVENVFLIMVLPFLIYYFLGMISPYFYSYIGASGPALLLDMEQAYQIKLWMVLIHPLILGGLCVALFLWKGVKNDVF